MDSTEDQIHDPLNFTNSTVEPTHRPGLFIRMFEVRDLSLSIPLSSHQFPSGFEKRPDADSKASRRSSMAAGVDVSINPAVFDAFLTIRTAQD